MGEYGQGNQLERLDLVHKSLADHTYRDLDSLRNCIRLL